MKKSLVANLHKKIGETPLDRIKRFKKKNPEFQNVPLTYAGRLDPMAEGVLLVLGGDAIKEKEKFLSLTKEYYFEVLWGLETDTFDILGKVNNAKTRCHLSLPQEALKKALKEIKLIKAMKYPPFSSKTLRGVPLFKLSRKGLLKKKELPSRKVKIYYLRHLKTFSVSAKKLEATIKKRISSVQGDFRQEEILKFWQEVFKHFPENFLVSSFQTKVSSGTYIRRLTQILGQKLKFGAVCLKIKREKVGDFSIQNSQV